MARTASSSSAAMAASTARGGGGEGAQAARQLVGKEGHVAPQQGAVVLERLALAGRVGTELLHLGGQCGRLELQRPLLDEKVVAQPRARVARSRRALASRAATRSSATKRSSSTTKAPKSPASGAGDRPVMAASSAARVLSTKSEGW